MATTISSFPEQGILDSIASTALNLANAQYAWGQDQFAQNSALTQQVVGNYLSSAGTLTGAAQTDLNFYQSTFMPEMQALVNDANDYASSSRIQQRMGMAESQTAQASQQQRQNALADLQSYGIDPSSGRYAALDSAERMQQAAAEAGAGNIAELQTEATGRALRSEAIQVGQRLPGQFVQEAGTALQALAGAENSQLANSKLGADLLGTPKDYLGTGMGLKYPPTGGTSGGSHNPFPPEAGTSGVRSPPSVNVGGTPGYMMPNNTAGYTPEGSGNMSGMQPTANVLGGMGGGNYGADGSDDSNMNLDPSLAGSPGSDIYGPVNPGADTSGMYNNSGSPGGANDMTMGDSPDSSSGALPDSSYGGDTSYDQPSYSDSGYNDGGAVGLAAGGAASDGDGAVPTVTPQMSPTGGRDTDDVSARLNVGEFVIPKDVAEWKGQEFFQKLIQQSRKLRGAAPARGEMKPALNRPPAFQSRPTPSQGAIPAGQ